MTFDELHDELRGQMKWYQRVLLPRPVTLCALRAAVKSWRYVGASPEYGKRYWLNEARSTAKRDNYGSIWVMLIFEALKIIIPWLIELWRNRPEEFFAMLESMKP